MYIRYLLILSYAYLNNVIVAPGIAPCSSAADSLPQKTALVKRDHIVKAAITVGIVAGQVGAMICGIAIFSKTESTSDISKESEKIKGRVGQLVAKSTAQAAVQKILVYAKNHEHEIEPEAQDSLVSMDESHLIKSFIKKVTDSTLFIDTLCRLFFMAALDHKLLDCLTSSAVSAAANELSSENITDLNEDLIINSSLEGLIQDITKINELEGDEVIDALHKILRQIMCKTYSERVISGAPMTLYQLLGSVEEDIEVCTRKYIATLARTRQYSSDECDQKYQGLMYAVAAEQKRQAEEAEKQRKASEEEAEQKRQAEEAEKQRKASEEEAEKQRKASEEEAEKQRKAAAAVKPATVIDVHTAQLKAESVNKGAAVACDNPKQDKLFKHALKVIHENVSQPPVKSSFGLSLPSSQPQIAAPSPASSSTMPILQEEQHVAADSCAQEMQLWQEYKQLLEKASQDYLKKAEEITLENEQWKTTKNWEISEKYRMSSMNQFAIQSRVKHEMVQVTNEANKWHEKEMIKLKSQYNQEIQNVARWADSVGLQRDQGQQQTQRFAAASQTVPASSASCSSNQSVPSSSKPAQSDQSQVQNYAAACSATISDNPKPDKMFQAAVNSVLTQPAVKLPPGLPHPSSQQQASDNPLWKQVQVEVANGNNTAPQPECCKPEWPTLAAAKAKSKKFTNAKIVKGLKPDTDKNSNSNTFQ